MTVSVRLRFLNRFIDGSRGFLSGFGRFLQNPQFYAGAYRGRGFMNAL